MPYIETIPPKRATGEVSEVYAYMAEMGGLRGLVANIVQMFSLRPESMRRMIRRWELTMWVGEEPRHRRELLASMVSRQNDCFY